MFLFPCSFNIVHLTMSSSTQSPQGFDLRPLCLPPSHVPLSLLQLPRWKGYFASSSTVSPSFTCTAFTTPVTPLERLFCIFINSISLLHMYRFHYSSYPAGKAILHLHRLHYSTLLAITNLITNSNSNCPGTAFTTPVTPL